MLNHDLYVRTQHRRVKYPRRLYLPSVEAAHEAAVRLARIFVEGRSCWEDVSIGASDAFTVDIVNEAGQAILTIPSRWVASQLLQPHARPFNFPHPRF